MKPIQYPAAAQSWGLLMATCKFSLISAPILNQAALVSGWSRAPISSMQHVFGGVHLEPLQPAQPIQFQGEIATTRGSLLAHS